MNLSLRTRFFLLLMGFMLFCFALNYSADLAHEYLLEHLDDPTSDHAPLGEFLTFLVVNLALMPAVLVLGWWMARRMTAPVAEAAEIATRIADGQLGERVPEPDGPAEIAHLVRALNRAFDRYAEDLRRIQQFSSHAAHQLRTPLAALRAQVEVTLNRTRTPQEYQESLLVVLERLQDWSRSVERMLDLAELESTQWSTQFVPVDLNQLLHRVQDGLAVLADEKRVALDLKEGNPAWALGDETLLEQLLANLLDNAIRYTPSEGRVNLAIQAQPESVRITISDTGPGMAAEVRQRIMDRLARPGGGEQGGNGLGLAIAAEIIRIHKGQLAIHETHPHGTRIEITFPVMPRHHLS